MVLSVLSGCATSGSAPGAINAHARWEESCGGITCDPCPCCKATAALARVAGQTLASRLDVKVLDSSSPVAYSFPDGSIYIARGLVDRLTPDELAAVIAHEMGHLFHDGNIPSPAALRGIGSISHSRDIESAADCLGRQLLIEQGIDPKALPNALQKVADASRNSDFYAPLSARIRYLRSLDSTP